MLHGRDAEKHAIDGLLAAARAGRAGSLAMYGPAGIGKSALLDYAAGASAGALVLRVVGIESEAELPYAALHALLHPVIGATGALSGPQAAALCGALGLADAAGRETAGTEVPVGADRFLVGLAVLSLLAELSGQRPLLCLVDDAQWLDRASADALLFAVRRLHAEPVAVVVAARDDDAPSLSGLAQLRLAGLDRPAAEAVLAAQEIDLARAVRDRLVDEAAGNPLALVELPHALSPAQRAGALNPVDGFGSGPGPLLGRVQASFRLRIGALPEATRRCLLVAALAGSGATTPVVRAAEALGLAVTDFAPAEQAGLLTMSGTEITFRHPLVRAVVQGTCTLAQRVAAHRALAAAVVDDDRRAWHLAAAATGPDEAVAVQLERTAERAAARGGHAAVAAAYERAAELSEDPIDGGRRLTAAATAAGDAGQLPRAGVLAARASGLVHVPRLRARLAQVLGRLEFETGTPLTAARIAVDGLERVDPGDRATALSLGDQALLYTWYSPYDPEQDVLLARIERAMRPVGAEAATGLRLLWAQDYSRALPLLRISVAAQPEPTRLIGTGLGLYLADPAVAHVGAAALVAHHRTNGLAGALPQALVLMTTAYLLTGRHRDAKTAAADALRIAHDTGQSYRVGHLTALRAYLAAASGDDDGQSLAAEAVRHSADGTRMANTAWAEAALALRDGAAGRFGAALERLEAAAHGPGRHSVPVLLGLPDHVEAAVRAERPELAAAPLARFAAWAEATGQPAVLGTAARCRALTSTGSAAESAYAEAAELHAEAGQRFEQARTELVYGEWLRRQRRRGEARARLAVAVELLDELGNVAWLERACGELRATGAPAPTTSGGRDPLASLTPQERQVVRLAATGASNREIAAQLFLSARTVGYHLYKAFPKLGVSNRAQLARFDLPVTP